MDLVKELEERKQASMTNKNTTSCSSSCESLDADYEIDGHDLYMGEIECPPHAIFSSMDVLWSPQAWGSGYDFHVAKREIVGRIYKWVFICAWMSDQ